MLDLADLLSGTASEELRAEIKGRLVRMVPSIAIFATGCCAAALIFIGFGLRAFLLPPLVALAAVIAVHLDQSSEVT
jgi:uncharacterized membrane protein YoaK (UPF0700 family)